MSSQKRLLKTGLAALAALLTTLATVSAAAPQQTQPMPGLPQKSLPVLLDQKLDFLPDVVARYGEETITAEDFKNNAASQLAAIVMRQNLPEDRMKEAVRGVLKGYLQRRILFEKARKAGYEADSEAATEKVAEMTQNVGGEERLQQVLDWQGMTKEDLTSMLAREMALKQWIEQEIKPGITISEEEARKFYKENPDQFVKPEQVAASHILIASGEDATPEEKKEAREKANSLLEKLEEGDAEFAELAEKHSACPSGERSGGDLGFFSKGQMVPAFEKVAFGLQEGELSDVVETSHGYHIIRGGEHKEGETREFDAVKTKLNEWLKDRKIQDVIQEKIDAAWKDADVEILLEA